MKPKVLPWMVGHGLSPRGEGQWTWMRRKAQSEKIDMASSVIYIIGVLHLYPNPGSGAWRGPLTQDMDFIDGIWVEWDAMETSLYLVGSSFPCSLIPICLPNASLFLSLSITTSPPQ